MISDRCILRRILCEGISFGKAIIYLALSFRLKYIKATHNVPNRNEYTNSAFSEYVERFDVLCAGVQAFVIPYADTMRFPFVLAPEMHAT